MKKPSGRIPLLAAGIGMLLLILDSRCAAQSAQSALSVCLKSVIPSLFPMFVLSGILVSGVQIGTGRLVSCGERILALPSGAGPIFLLGILGGFPVGAQCITQAVEQGMLEKQNGEKMLGFCNNCSPAFLFGICGSLFEDKFMPLWIFLIQLESAAWIGAFCGVSCSAAPESPSGTLSLSSAVARAIKSMATVCAWVILASVVNGILKRWLFPFLPEGLSLLIGGFLEVTGGVLHLAAVPDPPIRFVLCTMLICFGGISVLMQIQTICAASGLSISSCVRQKMMQCAIGALLSCAVMHWGPVCLIYPAVILPICKKALENPKTSVYNSSRKGGLDHVIPKEN